MTAAPAGTLRLRAFARFLLGVLVLFVAEFLAGGIAGLVSERHRLLMEAVFRTASLLFVLAGFGLLLIGVDKVPDRPLARMGLDPQARPGPQWLLGMGIGSAMVLVCVSVMAVAGNLHFELALTPRNAARALLALFVLTAAAMGEEVSFRGYPLQRLVEAVGAAGAVVLSSLLFGVLHALNPHASRWAIANTAAFGALMAVAYLRTRQLWLPWGMHLGWNVSLGFIFGLPVSGFKLFAIVVKGTATGPAWLTGGSYGVEGGALGTAMTLLGVIAVLYLTRRPWLHPRTYDAASAPVVGLVASPGGAPATDER